MKNHVLNYFNKNFETIQNLDYKKIEKLAKALSLIKNNKGRIFLIGVGGSAANCSHMVNDLRKICELESYTPTDNVSELTARINDDGWDSSFANWLKISNLNKKDALFILSVGGGNKKLKVSVNLIKAIDFAIKRKAKIYGIVGKKDGYTYKKGNLIIAIPETDKNLITPISESFQSVIWHCLVSHPLLKRKPTKW
ncbi:MAG: Phosphoheptose isomerase [Alphaproteobacteria bacterium MarineAlpha5_Bin12]|nr:MAG: Phosphoheptose isomerase [Alphaproteobacteria bacterium MarineAlpha5_Bin12]|tara:strand:+ start:5622 stop:6209 length:588 start_codon:yes stop_codon:yes gene_type:complete